MYQANLSYKLLCRYLGEVLDAGLVRFENEERYVLTTKGREFLERHQEYSERCKNLEEHLNSLNGEKVALEKMCFNAGMGDGGSRHLTRKKELRSKDE